MIGFLDSIFHWFSAAITHGILVAGLVGTGVGFFSRFIPGVTAYALPIKIVSIILLVCGIFLEGKLYADEQNRQKIIEMQIKLDIAKKQVEDLTVKLEEEMKKKIKIIHDTKTVYKDRIIHVKDEINKECKVSPVVVDVLNGAAQNKPVEVK